MNIKPERLESWQHYGESLGLGPKYPTVPDIDEDETCRCGDELILIGRTKWGYPLYVCKGCGRGK